MAGSGGGGGGGAFVAHLDTLNGIMSFPGFCLLKFSESRNILRHKLDAEAGEDEEDEAFVVWGRRLQTVPNFFIQRFNFSKHKKKFPKLSQSDCKCSLCVCKRLQIWIVQNHHNLDLERLTGLRLLASIFRPMV